eukprot:9114568-Heterocapsa_arctica.AAC.1
MRYDTMRYDTIPYITEQYNTCIIPLHYITSHYMLLQALIVRTQRDTHRQRNASAEWPRSALSLSSLAHERAAVLLLRTRPA